MKLKDKDAHWFTLKLEIFNHVELVNRHFSFKEHFLLRNNKIQQLLLVFNIVQFFNQILSNFSPLFFAHFLVPVIAKLADQLGLHPVKWCFVDFSQKVLLHFFVLKFFNKLHADAICFLETFREHEKLVEEG